MLHGIFVDFRANYASDSKCRARKMPNSEYLADIAQAGQTHDHDSRRSGEWFGNRSCGALMVAGGDDETESV